MTSLEEKSHIAIRHFVGVRADSFGKAFQKQYWEVQPDALCWGRVERIAQSNGALKNTTDARLVFHGDPHAREHVYSVDDMIVADFHVAPEPPQFKDNPYVRSLGAPAAVPSTGARARRKPANLADFDLGSDGDELTSAESPASSVEESNGGESNSKCFSWPTEAQQVV